MAKTRAQTKGPDEVTSTPEVAPVSLAGATQASVGNAAVADRMKGQAPAGGREDISRYTPQYVEAHRDELGIPAGAPVEDFFNEFVAHRLAYQQMSKQNPDDPNISQGDRDRILAQRQMLESWGYNGNITADNEVYDPTTGLYAVRFDPNEQGLADGRSSKVAFRGTEPLATNEASPRSPWSPFNDVVTDFGPSVGSTQYDPNKDAIRDLMAGGTGQVTATGHSLGGYIAQRAAADNADLTGDVVTFQAGGLNREDANRFNDANADGHIGVRHHYTTADVVHRAGEQRLDGTFFEHQPDHLTEGHTKYLMYDDNDVTTLAEATGGKTVTESDHDTVSPWSRHLWEGARTGVGGLLRSGMALPNAAWTLGNGLGNGLLNAGSGVADALSTAGGGLAQGGADLWNGASNGLGQMMNGDILGGMGTMGGGLLNGGWNAGSGLAQGAWDLGKTGLGLVGDTGKAVWDGASSLVSDTVTGGVQMLRGGVNLAEGAVGAGWEATKAAGNMAVDAATTVGNAAWDGAKWAGNTAAQAGEAAWDGAKWAGNKAVDTAAAAGSAAWDGAKWAGGKAADAASAVGNAAVDSAAWVGNKAADVGSAISGGAKAAWDIATGW